MIKTKEEILSDNMSVVTHIHIQALPHLEQWILDAMEEYANQFKEQPKKSIEERSWEFKKKMADVVGQPICYSQTTIEFFDYWTEISPNAKKMRFEKEKVFDIKKRLERWKRNQKQTTNGTTTKQTRHDKFESAFARTDENSGAEQTFDKV